MKNTWMSIVSGALNGLANYQQAREQRRQLEQQQRREDEERARRDRMEQDERDDRATAARERSRDTLLKSLPYIDPEQRPEAVRRALEYDAGARTVNPNLAGKSPGERQVYEAGAGRFVAGAGARYQPADASPVEGLKFVSPERENADIKTRDLLLEAYNRKIGQYPQHNRNVVQDIRQLYGQPTTQNQPAPTIGLPLGVEAPSLQFQVPAPNPLDDTNPAVRASWGKSRDELQNEQARALLDQRNEQAMALANLRGVAAAQSTALRERARAGDGWAKTYNDLVDSYLRNTTIGFDEAHRRAYEETVRARGPAPYAFDVNGNLANPAASPAPPAPAPAAPAPAPAAPAPAPAARLPEPQPGDLSANFVPNGSPATPPAATDAQATLAQLLDRARPRGYTPGGVRFGLQPGGVPSTTPPGIAEQFVRQGQLPGEMGPATLGPAAPRPDAVGSLPRLAAPPPATAPAGPVVRTKGQLAADTADARNTYSLTRTAREKAIVEKLLPLDVRKREAEIRRIQGLDPLSQARIYAATTLADAAADRNDLASQRLNLDGWYRSAALALQQQRNDIAAQYNAGRLSQSERDALTDQINTYNNVLKTYDQIDSGYGELKDRLNLQDVGTLTDSIDALQQTLNDRRSAPAPTVNQGQVNIPPPPAATRRGRNREENATPPARDGGQRPVGPRTERGEGKARTRAVQVAGKYVGAVTYEELLQGLQRNPRYRNNAQGWANHFWNGGR